MGGSHPAFKFSSQNFLFFFPPSSAAEFFFPACTALFLPVYLFDSSSSPEQPKFPLMLHFPGAEWFMVFNKIFLEIQGWGQIISSVPAATLSLGPEILGNPFPVALWLCPVDRTCWLFWVYFYFGSEICWLWLQPAALRFYPGDKGRARKKNQEPKPSCPSPGLCLWRDNCQEIEHNRRKSFFVRILYRFGLQPAGKEQIFTPEVILRSSHRAFNLGHSTQPLQGCPTKPLQASFSQLSCFKTMCFGLETN